jgi:hypothetical protein
VRKRTWLWGSFAALILALIAVRLALPSVVKSYVNRHLADMDEYTGHVTDVDLGILRGAYTIHGLEVVKRDSTESAPFAVMDHMDISLQWSALLHGELVGEIVMQRPRLNMVQAESDRDTQLGTGVNWPAEVRKFFPFRFNRVEVRDGTATFRAPGIDTDESLTVQKLAVVLRDLTNVEERRTREFASLQADGRVMGNAPIALTGQFDPNASKPVFDLNLSLERAELVNVNPWLRRFLNVDAQRGTFSMYSELAASDGRFEGYVKPILVDPDIFDVKEPASGPFQRAWEALVGIGTKLLKNPDENQVATEIPLSGELEDPSADLVSTVVNLFRNAFVYAFSHSLDRTVGLKNGEVPFETTGGEEEGKGEARKSAPASN